MLSFLKSKPKLKELIPEGFIDIHSHVLPGLDDGAQNITETKFLLQEMTTMGFSKIITTPHTKTNVWENSSILIKENLKETSNVLDLANSRISLDCASEYFMDEEFVKRFKSEKLLTLKNNHVLVEMSYLNAPLQLYDFLFELQLEGYKPVLAHPERYMYFHNKPEEYEKLKKSGCLFQINLLSVTGYYGKDVMNIAESLLKRELIDFTGSDIHNKEHISSFNSSVKTKAIKELQEAIENNSFFN